MPVTPASSRAVLRPSQRFLFRRTPAVRRHASSASDAASKAKETAAKAQQSLSKLTATAGPAIANAAQNLGNALRRVGGRTGKVIAFVDSLIPPTVYYSKVGIELAKLVFKGQNMAPPSLATFQSYFQSLLNTLRNPSALKNINFPNPQQIIARILNPDRYMKELAFYGVTAAEILGFWSVGEMIGRRKIVGYRGEPAHGH
ncbi:putative mitochondrial F1F0-ATP synthase g subunit [Thermoascus aurantiacus ATCC 26904]